MPDQNRSNITYLSSKDKFIGATRGGATEPKPPLACKGGGLAPPWPRGPALNIDYLFDLNLFYSLILDKKAI